MKFSIEKQVFLKGLSRIQSIVERKNTIPVLANVLIEAKDSQIFLTATDLEVAIRSSYPASHVDGGKITVSAKKLFEIVRELPEGEISFQSKENCWIEIRSGKAHFNLVGLSPEEFPYFPSTDVSNKISFNEGVINQLIEKTSFAMSSDETKYNLNGIYFKSKILDGKNYLTLVATDGHRLSKIYYEIDENFPEFEKGHIFPRKGINELKKISEDGEGKVQIGFLENSAVILKDNTTIVIRLVDGDFPDYERVIPKNNDLIAEINTSDFLHTIRRMSTISSDKTKGIKISLKKSSMEVFSSNPELGEAREQLEVNYDGPEISVGFNAKYILDILQVIEEEKVRFCIKDNMSPGIIKPENSKDFTTVIMPMRL